MTILVIVGSDSNNKSLINHLKKLTKILTEATDEQLVLLAQAPPLKSEYIPSYNVQVYPVKGHQRGMFQFFWSQIKISVKIIKLVKKYRPRLIIFAFGQDLRVIPIFIAKLMRTKLILRSDGRPSYILNPTGVKQKLFNIIEEIMYSNVTLLLVESESIWKEQFKKYSAKVAHLFVPQDFRSVLSLTERKFDVGFFGRFSEQKNISTVLQTFLSLPTYIQIVLTGEGQKESKVREVSSKNPNVHYLGVVDKKEFINILNSTKIILLPSKWEGLPNILLEGMACGCVPVATPVGGVPDVIINQKTGVLLHDTSHEDIKSIVMDLLKNPKNIKKYSWRARNLIEKKYRLKNVARRWEKWLAL